MGLLCSPVSERPRKPVRHDGNKDLKMIPGLNLQRRETEGLGHTLTSLLLVYYSRKRNTCIYLHTSASFYLITWEILHSKVRSHAFELQNCPQSPGLMITLH